MRLSWNEVRARAAVFAEDWKDASYEKGETQSFYNAFFDVFGVRRRNVARYEAHVAKLDNHSGFIDLFWPGVLLVEQKSAGRDLRKAYQQAGEYFDALPERERPRFILVSDFQTFELHDLDEREVVAFALADLPTHVESFGFILGVQRRTFRDQDPANIEAAELVGRLRRRLKSDYRYSSGLVYNTFPTPPKGSDLSRLEPLAQAVFDARTFHSGVTLADLYDPDLMPSNLRTAHQAIDRAVDRLYRRNGFASERERVEHLFMLYEKMRAPLSVCTKKRERRKG